MGFIEIRELRKKQFISINMQSIVFFVSAGTLIWLLEPTRITVLLLMIVFMAVSCLFTWREIGGKEWRKSEWARQLVTYEKEKLGRFLFLWVMGLPFT